MINLKYFLETICVRLFIINKIPLINPIPISMIVHILGVNLKQKKIVPSCEETSRLQGASWMEHISLHMYQWCNHVSSSLLEGVRIWTICAVVWKLLCTCWLHFCPTAMINKIGKMNCNFKMGHIHLFHRTLYVISIHVLLSMDYVNISFLISHAEITGGNVGKLKCCRYNVFLNFDIRMATGSPR
jgi:hypothetical protein